MKSRRYRVEEINKDRLGLFAAEDPLKGEVGFNVQEVAVIRIMKGTCRSAVQSADSVGKSPSGAEAEYFQTVDSFNH